MSSLNKAVLQIHYMAWQEIDVSFIAESLDGDYDCNNLESLSVEGYDVIVKTDDGKEHTLEKIIPDLVLETDRPTRLELWNEVKSGEHTRMVREANTLPSVESPVLKLGGWK